MRVIHSLIAIMAAAMLITSCEKKSKPTRVESVKVKTMVVEPASVGASRIYSGTVEESSGSSISFSVAGTLQRINVSAGDRVAQGQLIATLDETNLRHAYDIAKATLDEARDAYNRMKQLYEANSLPDMKWVEIQNTLRQAESAEAIAKKTLDDAKLFAPFSGYVSEKYVDAGMTVAPGIPVIKIVTINPVKVNISIPENEIADFAVGQSATVTLGALSGETFTGRLTERGVAANPISRSYSVKYEVANPAGVLLPGMIADVAVDRGAETAPAIILPTNSVLLDAQNRNFVWLDKGGKAVKRIVDVSGMTDTGLVISSGVAAGDSVIVAGQQKVSENMKVESI